MVIEVQETIEGRNSRPNSPSAIRHLSSPKSFNALQPSLRMTLNFQYKIWKNVAMRNMAADALWDTSDKVISTYLWGRSRPLCYSESWLFSQHPAKHSYSALDCKHTALVSTSFIKGIMTLHASWHHAAHQEITSKLVSHNNIWPQPKRLKGKAMSLVLIFNIADKWAGHEH